MWTQPVITDALQRLINVIYRVFCEFEEVESDRTVRVKISMPPHIAVPGRYIFLVTVLSESEIEGDCVCFYGFVQGEQVILKDLKRNNLSKSEILNKLRSAQGLAV